MALALLLGSEAGLGEVGAWVWAGVPILSGALADTGGSCRLICCSAGRAGEAEAA